MQKICSKCGIPKDISKFRKHKGCNGGHAGTCFHCNNLSSKPWRMSHKVYINKQQTLWRKRNPKKWKSINQKRISKCPRVLRYDHVKCKYGLSPDQYENMLAKQNNVCAICSNPETRTFKGKVKSLAVDHCHKTNVVRGLLCSRCNIALGLLRDDIKNIERMRLYLLKTRTKK